MSDLLEVTYGHLSNMHKYGISLNFNYFNSEELRQPKRFPYSIGKLNLFIEFKINRQDIYLFNDK